MVNMDIGVGVEGGQDMDEETKKNERQLPLDIGGKGILVILTVET